MRLLSKIAVYGIGCTILPAQSILINPKVEADTYAVQPKPLFINHIYTEATGPVDQKFLTQEATYSSPITGSTNWHGFFSQSGRNITMQLDNVVPVQKMSVQFEQNPKAGVFYPAYVDFQANIGGTWYEVGRVSSAIPQSDSRISTQTFSSSLKNVDSDLFRIHFPVDHWVFARNLQLLGNLAALPTGQPVSDTTYQQVPTAQSEPLNEFDSRAHGVHNMLLVYTGDHGTTGRWSTSDFLPLTGYRLTDGTIGGRMMDSMLFLPYGTIQDTQQGWLTYLQDLFSSNSNLSALDTAVAQTNQAMNKYGYSSDPQERVVLTLPYPRYGDGNWGTINGQQIRFSPSKLDPSAINSRTRAVNWYLSTVIQMWNKAGFKNLKLDGIYWDSESINIANPGESQVIENISKAVHSDDLPFYWIPYYGAAGIEDWSSYGFDAAWLQPNYVEAGKAADPMRLENTEEQARDSGLGVEVEAPWRILSDPIYQQLYLNTLGTYETDGFAGQVSHVFYEDSKVLSQAAYSKDPSVRALYNETYSFITNP